MLDNKEKIIRSSGVTQTEKILAKICEKTFLKLWVYPNVYKKKGDELCDLLVVFENNIFIFSIKSIKFNNEKELDIAWKRWKKKAIDESMQQIQRAESWIIKNPEKIFLDAKCEKKLPITIDVQNLKIHRILVAHGAMEACKNHSEDNIAGSLAISYSNSKSDYPFFLSLDREKIYHILDSYNLEIILGELDTISDLTWYFEAKEEAVKRHTGIIYCGEEDLLAHYFLNSKGSIDTHFIGIKGNNEVIHIKEGYWLEFKQSEQYYIRKVENKISYLWDKLIQDMSQCVLDKTIGIFGDIGNNFDSMNYCFGKNNPLCEMAKEPRFFRRILSEGMTNSISKSYNFKNGNIVISLYPSFYPNKGYIFLQLKKNLNDDYDNDYRPVRIELLFNYCVIEKNTRPKWEKIIGIATDFPNSKIVTKDFMILDCAEWSQNNVNEFINIDKNIKKMNKIQTKIRTSEFSKTYKIYEKKKHIK